MQKTTHLPLFIATILILASLATVVPAALAAPITVQTDKDAYGPGESLNVSGTATANAWISIQLFNPDGNRVAIAQAGSDGAWSATGIYTFAEDDPQGTWTVKAYDSATGETAETTFTFPAVPADTIPPTLTVSLVPTKDLYGVETITIVVQADEPLGSCSITVTQAGASPTTVEAPAAVDDPTKWGGYPWYPRLLREWGYAKLHETMWEDLIRGEVETLARENKIAQMFDIELRYPYLDIDVIKTAMSVAPQLKVFSDKDQLGKRVHRALAKKLGVPTFIAERKKTAAQHGAGIHKALLQIANKHGFNEKLVSKLNYSPDKISAEKLGSSSRYGYKYGDKDAWLLPSCVQLYFDYIAYHEGLLNKNEREKIATILKNLSASQ
jgi:hypothetical protein